MTNQSSGPVPTGSPQATTATPPQAPPRPGPIGSNPVPPPPPTPEQSAQAAAMVGRMTVESQKQNTQSVFEREKQAAFRAISAQKAQYLDNLKSLQSLQGIEQLRTLNGENPQFSGTTDRAAQQRQQLTDFLLSKIIEEVKTLIAVEVEKQLAARVHDNQSTSSKAPAPTNAPSEIKKTQG